MNTGGSSYGNCHDFVRRRAVVAVTVTSVGVISIRKSLRRIARGKEDGHV